MRRPFVVLLQFAPSISLYLFALHVKGTPTRIHGTIQDAEDKTLLHVQLLPVDEADRVDSNRDFDDKYRPTPEEVAHEKARIYGPTLAQDAIFKKLNEQYAQHYTHPEENTVIVELSKILKDIAARFEPDFFTKFKKATEEFDGVKNHRFLAQ